MECIPSEFLKKRPDPSILTRYRQLSRALRTPVDPLWVEHVFDKVTALVEEGDAAGLAAVVMELGATRGVLSNGARLAHAALEEVPDEPAAGYTARPGS